MDKLLTKSLLFDIYASLLTEKQRAAFDMYYLNDFSLNEIATEWKVTPQAVRDLLKRTDKTLAWYDEKLRMIEKHEKLKRVLNETIQYVTLNADNDCSREIVLKLTDVMNCIPE